MAALLAPAAAGAADPGALIAGTFTPARVAPEFVLQGSGGKELKLSDYRGKVVVLGFGYTNCPAVCPTTLAVLAAAHKKLGALAGGVQVLYVTVDPQRDDAKRMGEFLGHFDPGFVGGTGSEAQLAAVRKDYGIESARVPMGDSYGYNHSSYTILVDREGRLHALMPYGHSADDYVHDVKILLGR
jgi:protein SCO1/2